jgi:hypothetical protein
MVADWIISAGTIVVKCVAVALTFVACIALFLVETNSVSEQTE